MTVCTINSLAQPVLSRRESMGPPDGLAQTGSTCNDCRNFTETRYEKNRRRYKRCEIPEIPSARALHPLHPAQRPPRMRPRVCRVVDHRLPVDQHMVDAHRELLGVFEGGRGADGVGVEDYEVGLHAVAQAGSPPTPTPMTFPPSPSPFLPDTL